MKKLYIISMLYFAFSLLNPAKTQTIFLQEGFENGGKIPTGWTQVKKTGNALWDFFNGGAIPPGTLDGLPPEAHTGSYNARFFKSSFSVHETFLISPEFSFEFALKPELKFWYAQVVDQLPGSDPDNNKFKVYWRSPEAGNTWNLLKDLSDPTIDWVFESLPMPDNIKYKKVQLGFLGISSTVGFGSCIDDILLIETDTVTKYIEKVYATQPNLDIIPSGSSNNPILRLRFPVQGNDGNLFLDSLVITALEKAAEVVAPNGVKLFFTISDYFSNSTPIGTASFVNGKAIFNGIHKELPFGNSYVWVTYDIPEDTQHQFKNIKVDAKIDINSIKVSNSYFPTSELTPNGVRIINESVFFDDYESAKPWTLTGEFQRDTAKGLGGFYQHKDPNYAVSGVKVLGTDLTGLGSKLGDYELGISANQYTATTSNFDGSFYKGLNLQFYRWLNVNFSDTAAIDYSTDNGSTWVRIWNNSALVAENEWKFQQISFTNLLDRKPNIKLRFTLGPTSLSQSLSGWNIDNFAFTGSYVNYDVGISALISPISGCGHAAPEVVQVTVKNYGFDATPAKIPVGYSINGGVSYIYDTVRTVIPKNGSVNFTFSQLVDFTALGNHTLQVKTFLADDEDNRNDLVSTTIYTSPTYTIPYVQNFETNDGYWVNGGSNTTWEYGKPAGSKINKAYSGLKCWGTNIDGNYVDNDSTWLESPCFDFTGIDKPIIDFMLWANAEPTKDGLALYYTINDGTNWVLVPTQGSYNWNWYNKPNIEAFNHAGWDSVTNKWFKARQILPNAVANVGQVKFRFLFMSNDTITNEGFAIDDLKIYNAPTDAGIAAIVSPKNACSLSKTQAITVSVKNYGVRTITATDSIFTTLLINNTTTVKDTFIATTPIAVNGTANFTFTETSNMFAKKWHTMKAYTQVKGDTSYYVAGVTNDTKLDSAYVTGEPYYTLGPDIGTLNADTVVLDGKLHSISGLPFVKYKWNYIGRSDSTATIDSIRYFGVPSFPNLVDYLNFAINVKNDSGCFIKDTIQIIKSNTDIGILSATGIANKCIDNQDQIVDVTVKNFSASYTLVTGTEIKVGYKLGESSNEDAYIESFDLATDLLAGNTVNYQFSVQPTYTKEGAHNLSLFTQVNADLDYSNDTLYKSVTILPLPEVELGADSLLTMQGDTLILDAGTGSVRYTYEWQDASVDTTFNVTSNLTSLYSVTVSDSAGCGSATDNVLVISDNWILDSLIAPVSQCSPSASKQISVLLINNSPNTFNTGYKIGTQINVNETLINEPITLKSTLAPFDSIEYTFASIINMNTAKEYIIKVKINPTHDFNRNDNLLEEIVNIWGIKKVNIGADSIITQRADTILLNASNNFETYEWQDGSTASTFQILTQNSETYWINVTDYNNCPASSDTLRIKAHDLAMEEIITPESECDISGINTITFSIKNIGPDIVPIGEKINIKYFVNNGTPKSQVYIMTSDLFPNQSKQITLTEAFNFNATNTYKFTLYVDWSKDYYSQNDTLKTTIYQLEHPIVSLGPDISTSRADTVVLRTKSGYTNYKWQNSSRADTLDVTKNYSSNYWVNVGNSFGCFETDSLNIYTYDIGVGSINNLNICSASPTNNLTINIKVNSQDTLKAGQKITATYNFKGTLVSETLTLTNNFSSAATLPFTFATPFAVADTGNYSITCTVTMDKEVVTTNNSLVGSFKVGAYLVNLGTDITTYENSVTLDAGVGFTNYLWNDASTNRTLNISSTGTYKVTTTDVNLCSASDSIKVRFMKPGYDITEITGLSDNCTHSATETLSFKLKNSGNDTIAAASVIPIAYKINNETEVTGAYTFTEKFVPGSIVAINFATPANLSAAGKYDILVSVTIASKTSSNDTTVNTWGLPAINLGDDIDTPNDSVVLVAGTGFSSYLWNTTQTTQTITVKTDGNYSVTVTNNSGCSNSDMVKVFFIPASLYISEFVKPLLGCGEITNEIVTIIVKNGGLKTIPQGSSLTLGYQVEGNDRINEVNTLGNAVKPDISFEYSFTNKLTLSNSGNIGIKFYARLDGEDLDTADFIIPVYEKPLFFNGNDTIEVNAYPYKLDPKVTSDSYLWNTNETTPTIMVNNDGNYWVKIEADNTCEFTDTVYVKNITGIHDAWSSQISVNPNPGESEIWVNLPKNIGKVTLQITDLQGKVILVKKNVTDDFKLDIAKWNQGIYILRIHNENQFGVYQIVKQ